jgi:hypothetical protein
LAVASWVEGEESWVSATEFGILQIAMPKELLQCNEVSLLKVFGRTDK